MWTLTGAVQVSVAVVAKSPALVEVLETLPDFRAIGGQQCMSDPGRCFQSGHAGWAAQRILLPSSSSSISEGAVLICL